jgi:dipeptidyl aminopeptidase/acylaminoacyl peptidase
MKRSGEGDGPFAAILKTHGGPREVETERFSPLSQAWLDHRFAYLMIDYRGSTTFGRAFQEQIWGNPGHWELEDQVAARAWLIDQGNARAKQLLWRGLRPGPHLVPGLWP